MEPRLQEIEIGLLVITIILALLSYVLVTKLDGIEEQLKSLRRECRNG